jgi:hypothetical protein
MRFGTKVLVTRGSAGCLPGTPGALRTVRGVLVGASDHQCFVRLTEADPLSSILEWSHPGDIGTWEASQVKPDIEHLE